MHFQHLTYWQDKAKNSAIETRLFINGAYCDAADKATFETVNPATRQTLANVARGKQADVDLAVQAPREVFDRGDWSQASPAQRKYVLNKFADLMERHGEELALLETLDTGKPIRHSLRDDIPGAARAIRWYAEAADKVYGEVAPTGPDALAMIVREPIGVVAAIVPWNFPLLLACWKLGPALAAGNAMIFKPSEVTPLTALKLAEIYTEAGLPDGVFNVLPGVGAETGQYLTEHPGIAKVSFTGGVASGKKVMANSAASSLKEVTMELGGKSPLIVFDDADLDLAADIAMMANFFSSGQVCTNGTRVFVPAKFKATF